MSVHNEKVLKCCRFFVNIFFFISKGTMVIIMAENILLKFFISTNFSEIGENSGYSQLVFVNLLTFYILHINKGKIF